VRCLGSFGGCLLGVISVSRFCLGVFCWVFVPVFRVSFGSPVYTSCVRRGALRFLFYKILLIKKKKLFPNLFLLFFFFSSFFPSFSVSPETSSLHPALPSPSFLFSFPLFRSKDTQRGMKRERGERD
jgi:hypothetical protein